MNKIIQKALDNTIKEYKELIKEPLDNIAKWEGYGQYTKCALCKTVGVQSEDDVVNGLCSECPLYKAEYVDNNEKIPSCATTPSYSNFYIIINSTWRDSSIVDYETFIAFAKARLNYIKKLAKANGFVV